MDIQFNNASMVGTRSDRLNHIVIECPETTRKISEQAKKFFPGFSIASIERRALYEKKMTELTLNKAQNKRCSAWVGNRCCITTGSGLAGLW